MKENGIQTKSGITINITEMAKNLLYVKKIILGILLHVVATMENV